MVPSYVPIIKEYLCDLSLYDDYYYYVANREMFTVPPQAITVPLDSSVLRPTSNVIITDGLLLLLLLL